ncbi:DUF3048 domain-containing protein [Bacillus fonticola]|uniref:DUF3048 domain-containing protein n=1 Tax=Bacillus fonticola TaxID=2728853 RepID=UPI001474BB81|nr:DUF3048 domain-containing protein [Bacillus fonticola]
MYRLWKLGTIVATCTFILAACATSEETEPQPDTEPEVEEQERAEEAVADIEAEDPFIFPFTGKGTEEEAPTLQKPVVVTVNNHPAARPQTGLTEADIVMEILAEGDITRFLAFYQSEIPEKIGPVRSARDYFVNIARGYDSFFISHGYSPAAKELLDAGVVPNLNGIQYDGILFQRSSDRIAPHNSYITWDNILKGAEQNGYELEGKVTPFAFLDETEEESIKGNEASEVMVSYFNSPSFASQFQYDATIEKYTRSSGGEPTVDYETNEPVEIDNVLILETSHTVIDNVGRRKIDFTSGGNAYLLQKGKMQEVQWANVDGQILPVQDGQPVPFVRGKTWISVIPTNPGLDGAVSFDTAAE